MCLNTKVRGAYSGAPIIYTQSSTALDDGEWSASRCVLLYLLAPRYPLDGMLDGPPANSIVGEDRNETALTEIELQPSIHLLHYWRVIPLWLTGRSIRISYSLPAWKGFDDVKGEGIEIYQKTLDPNHRPFTKKALNLKPSNIYYQSSSNYVCNSDKLIRHWKYMGAHFRLQK